MDHVTRLSGNEVTMSTGDVVYFSRPRKKEATERIVSYLAGDD
ncbi:hypothetical protein QJ043_03950 [Olsenella sp. YH-ols2217]|uniref:Uncharacterized protein n=1 Tax=Kribbibacterium absianum TaxID=3044210 RepID=A0ABT6ZJK4_9ACTN|nr:MULTISPECIES: hypothetical protein [unclassified Olsenella]MDJ1122784.1 hypothetical protein [Olsenella sp. YH-ols2216]MDJ1129233.1 hypothetical protein [Olsenella sp. YH-ols2217]